MVARRVISRSAGAVTGSGATRHRTLLVAATGGHLEQLVRISARITPPIEEATWVTHDDAQSRSLLQGSSVVSVPYIPPRGYREMAQVVPQAARLLRRGDFDQVISTGAGIALPFFTAARLHGIDVHYIESAARADGPSLTGRITSRMPGAHLYSQYAAWAVGRWNYRGSLFDAFTAGVGPDRPIRRVVVTLGTMRTYAFHRLVDRLQCVLPQVIEPGAEILWQLGATQRSDLPGVAVSSMPGSELRSAIARADLVVAHAGIGSAITALELGRRPVLVPRRTAHGEHVDDHQRLIARELDGRGLAVSREADEILAIDLRLAARARVTTSTEPGPFALLSN